MSKMLSGAVGSVSRLGSECHGKTPHANVQDCIKLRDTRPPSAENCTFLTWAIPGDFGGVSARSLPPPVNSARLRAKQSLGAKFHWTVSARFTAPVVFADVPVTVSMYFPLGVPEIAALDGVALPLPPPQAAMHIANANATARKIGAVHTRFGSHFMKAKQQITNAMAVNPMTIKGSGHSHSGCDSGAR
jgi:hypothetical protein